MLSGSRDLDDTISLEDMPFERHYRGSMTSVNSITTTCTTDSNMSGGSVPSIGSSQPPAGSSLLPSGGSYLAPNRVS